MNLVETGHLATTLAFSVSQDLEDVRSRLRRYFGEDFVGVEDVFTAGAAEVPAAQHAAAAPPSLTPQRAADMGRPWRSTLLRMGYLGCALLLLWPVGKLLAEAPQLLTDASALQHGIRALQAGRNDEAYRVFFEVHRRQPESYSALLGMACVAARADDLDRWAVSTAGALASGMPRRGAGVCLRPAQANRFHLVVVGNIAILVPSAPPLGHIRQPGWTWPLSGLPTRWPRSSPRQAALREGQPCQGTLLDGRGRR
jgi:hypothetical protein